MFPDCHGPEQFERWDGRHVQEPDRATKHEPGGLLYVPHHRLEPEQRTPRQDEQPRFIGHSSIFFCSTIFKINFNTVQLCYAMRK